MRVMTLALIAVLLLAPAAHAQRPVARVPPAVAVPRDPLPRFTIAPRGQPLGPVGLPLPPIGLQPPIGEKRHGRRVGAYPWFAWPVYYAPELAVTGPPVEPVPARAPEPPAPGRLILDIEPAGAQVFSDGYYVGVPADFSPARGGGFLEAGPHRLDITAAGYEPLTTDLRVTSGQPVTIRGSLKAFPEAGTIPPTTFYLIPGCYMGNIPPKDARLPATCDPNRAVTWRP